MKSLDCSNITVIGLGLMGGSLAWALKPYCKTIVGVDKNNASIEYALDRQIIDLGTSDINKGISDADIIILATPVNEIISIIKKIGKTLLQNCIVMDIGSTKKLVVEQMKILSENVQAIGAHPMCGKELSGIEAADPLLYENKQFIITPLPNTSQQTIEMITLLINSIGAKALVLEPEYQDWLVTIVSHLPYLVSCGLMNIAIGLESENPNIWHVASSGFRDTTRLASSNVNMMKDIIFSNQENILHGIELMKDELEKFADLIKTSNKDDLTALLSDVQNRRNRIFQ